MPAACQSFTAPDGASLAYLDEGSGPPLLCLAGLTRSKEDFDPAMPSLRGCRVIRMDYRGRGASSYSGAASYTPEREAGDALALLDHLGIAKVALLGTSRGGLIGLGLASVAKERLSGLFLNDIGPEIEEAGLRRIAGYLGRKPRAGSYAEAALDLARHSPGFAGIAAEQWRALAERLYRETPQGLDLRYDPELRLAFMAAFQPERPLPDLWPLWAATGGLPVAVLRGANSDLLSRDTVKKMKDIRPDLLMAECADRGHAPFLDEPEARALLGSWLEACHDA